MKKTRILIICSILTMLCITPIINTANARYPPETYTTGPISYAVQDEKQHGQHIIVVYYNKEDGWDPMDYRVIIEVTLSNGQKLTNIETLKGHKVAYPTSVFHIPMCENNYTVKVQWEILT